MNPHRLLWGIALSALAPAVQAAGSCAATTLPTAFGNYNPVSPTALDGAGRVTVTCNLLLGISFAVSYEIRLGGGSFGTVAQRKMGVGASRLNYNLYTNSARSLIWGDGTTGATVSGSFLITLPLVVGTREHPVHARIPAQQTVPAGVYADTITVTVVY